MPRVYYVFLGLVALIAIVALVGFGVLSSRESAPSTEGVIATVGEEKIYSADLELEASMNPQLTGVDINKFYLDKLINDSLTLQAGEAEGKVVLDPSYFNNPHKDYAKRIEMVREVRSQVESSLGGVKGKVVSIWFYNNDYVGPLGYEEGKRVALEKLSALREQVAGGALTIDAAGEAIINDATIAQLDPAYKTNAIFSFDTTRDKKITFDDAFNSALASLAPGEVSFVFTLKDDETLTGETLDAVHVFGIVTEKSGGSGFASFEQWLNHYKSRFGIDYNI